MQKVVNDQLGEWFEKNPSEGKEIARKAQGAAVARLAARKARDARPQPQGSARRRRPARQARRLPVDQPRGVRALHRRGRLGRRPGQAGPRPAHPGDPADPRQDPERREGPHRPRAAEPGGPGASSRRSAPASRRRLRPGQAALPQGRADGRRRRRRPAHPHPAADAAVPVHARAGRAGSRLPRPAAAVQAQVVGARPRPSTPTPTASATPSSRPACAAGKKLPKDDGDPALQGSRRDEQRGAVGHHDGPGQAHPAAGHPGGRGARPTSSSPS